MKKVVLIWGVMLWLFPLGNARAVWVSLTADQIQEAQSFPEQHGKQALKELERRYTKKDGPFGDYITVRTKWRKLARLAVLKAEKGEALPAAEQTLILEDPFLQIDAVVYGHSLNFARDYRVFLRQNGRDIQPEKIHADHSQVSRRGRGLEGFPSYQAAIRTYYKYDLIDPLAKATIVLKKDGQEKKFEIDLSTFR